MHTLIENGQPHFGLFSEPVTLVRPADCDLRTPLGRRVGSIRRRLAYKQFHYLGGISDDVIFGATVADLGIMCTGFFYVYNLKTGQELRHTWRSPLSGKASFSENPETGQVLYGGQKDGISIDCANGRRILNVKRHGATVISASFEDQPPAIEPLRICTRAGYTGWVYVRKTGGVRTTGRIDCQIGQFDLSQCMGHTDYSCGFMRPETWWNWAFVSAVAGDQRLAINVSCGVNETSFTENCFWLSGKLHALPQARFQFDQADPLRDWRVQSDVFDLTFQSMGVHKEHVNAGILASRFSQVYGRFQGLVNVPGLPGTIKGLGFVEDHYAKW